MKGKEFEAKFKQACIEQGVLFVRFRDAGYRGETTDRSFTIRNIADCFVFNNDLLAICELKKRDGSLPFKDITQLKDLGKVNTFGIDNSINKMTVGLVVCFKELDNCWWVNLAAIDELKSIGKKSFNHKDCEAVAAEHPLLIKKIDTILPKRKKVPRLDMGFLKEII